MHVSKYLVVVAIGVAAAALVARADNQTPEFRAFWADAWHEGFQSPAQVSNLISGIRFANCNAIFVQARKRGDAYYQASPFEPVAASVAADFDPLAEVIRAAHDTNFGPRLEVHAWFVTYPATTIMRLTNKPPIITASLTEQHPFTLHPDWLDESDAGLKSDGTGYSFDPGHPAVQKHLFNVAMDIISRYDVDGFHFDHARYLTPNWGYNPVSVARFNTLFQRTGKPLASDPDWLQFRRDQITAQVRKIYLSAIALKPDLKISASTVAWAPGITSDDQWPTTVAYRTALQDWRAWMEEGILDINVPMDFCVQTNPVYARVFSDWAGFATDHKYSRQVVIGQGSWINSIAGTLAQIQAARQTTAASNTADGIALYSYAFPTGKASERPAFIAALTSATNQPPAFPAPVPVPDMPWKTQPTKGHLMGYTLGGSTSNALDGATITLSGPAQRKLTSDATGFYGAVDLPPGAYTLIASFPGYVSGTNTCTISAGKVTTQPVMLDAAAGGSH
jgi:uncharacterized lipoprotein YddW (UPF0748 family)